MKVTAVELTKEFTDNEESAGKKYYHRTLEVSGVVEDKYPEEASNPHAVIDLEGYGKTPGKLSSPKTVTCGFPKGSPSGKLVPSLKRGQKVTVKGTFDGDFVKMVRLKDCEFVEPKP